MTEHAEHAACVSRGRAIRPGGRAVAAPFSELTAAAADIGDDGRVITGRPVTIAAAFAEEQLAMGPLPAEPFDPARLLQARVDAWARVCVRQNYYPVRPAMPVTAPLAETKLPPGTAQRQIVGTERTGLA